MSVVSQKTAIAASAMMLLLLPLLYRFHRRQNKQNRIGGPISTAKTLWLGYAIGVYFLLAPLIAFDGLTIMHTLLRIFTLLMLFRAGLQSVLMYASKSWTPTVGISYNILSVTAIGGFLLVNLPSVMAHTADAQGQWLLFFTGIIVCCLLTDSYYAWHFHRIVGQATTGSSGVWFAAAGDARFDYINRLTGRMNWLFYAALLVFFTQIFLHL